MKFLKLKTILFSLMAIAMVTVFLSSCEKDIIDAQPEIESFFEKEKPAYYLLPFRYEEKMNGDELMEYVSSISEETMVRLVESRNIAHYFVSLNKENLLIENAKYGEVFDESTLQTHLNEEEVKEYNTFTGLNKLESRICCDDWDVSYGRCRTGYVYYYGKKVEYKYRYKYESRDCWCPFFDERKKTKVKC